MFPPLKVENQRTADYHANKATRPAARSLRCDALGHNLGLVWVVPLGVTPQGPISSEVVGALVQALDSGQGVIVHADREDTVELVANLVTMFAGGGHA